MKQLMLFGEPTTLEGEVVDETALDLAIEDALFRIKRDFDRTDGHIYLSFSGGKDSTILAHLMMMANLPYPIPFAFANTGVELNATLDFVHTFPYENIQILKPRKPFGQIMKDYGKPCLNKLKSTALSTYQRDMNNPFKKARAFQLVNGERIKDWKLVGGRNSYKLAKKHMHFLHPDTEIKFDSKCCDYLKKYPFEDFEIKHQMKGAFSGIRTAEGGVRAMAYTSCVSIQEKHGEDFIFSMPIIDWSNEVCDQFIHRYNIEISKAYTEYGLTRSGCAACPYSNNLKQELKVLYDHEPNRYKAMMFWLKDVYIYQQVLCDFDPVYMQEYFRRLPIIEKRKQDMIYAFRNPIKQKFFALLAGSIFAKKKAEETDVLYYELIEHVHENEEARQRFSDCYTTMNKPAWDHYNQMSYYSKKFERQMTEEQIEEILSGTIQFNFLRLKANVNSFTGAVKEEISNWKAEYDTLPGFYQVILSTQASQFIPAPPQKRKPTVKGC